MAKDNSNMGRPKIETADFEKGWEETILELSKTGASITEIAVELDISRNTLTRLTKDDVDFLNTIKRCKRFCECWWEAQGRKNLQNKEFNYTGWYMNMKNRFGWTDRVDNTTKGDKITSDEPVRITFKKKK